MNKQELVNYKKTYKIMNDVKKQLLEGVKKNAIVEETDDKITMKKELLAYVFYPYKGKNRKQYSAERKSLTMLPPEIVDGKLVMKFQKKDDLSSELPALFEEITEKIYNSLFATIENE